MLEQFLLSMNVVLPLFVVIGFGYLLNYFNIVEEKTFKQLNYLVFSILLPLHIANSLYKSSSEQFYFTSSFFPVIISLFIVLFILLIILAPKIEKEPTRSGVFVQGIIRANFIIIAFPIMDNLFGPQWLPLGSIVLSMSMILLNPLAVIALSIFQNKSINYITLFKNIITNPLILGTILGLILMNLSFKLPLWMSDSIDMISGLGTPLALVCLGGLFNIESIKHNLKSVSLVVIIKMCILPLVALGLAMFFKFTFIETMVAIILFAAPTAVTTYPMADAMGADGEFAQHIVIVTTLLSSVILVFWIAITHYFFT